MFHPVNHAMSRAFDRFEIDLFFEPVYQEIRRFRAIADRGSKQRTAFEGIRGIDIPARVDGLLAATNIPGS